jgi:O-succinylhomoserine sulfhydrylase
LERHCRNAERVAHFLAGHKKVKRVVYPGLPSHPQYELARRQMRGGGSLVTFDVAGGKPAAFRFMNALKLVDISNNLGDSKSLITHPATSTHQRLTAEQKAAYGINPGLVRLSVGLEDVEDLIGDLERGLKCVI